MRTRYFLDGDGQPSIRATIYEQPDHGISKTSIDIDARKICSRLRQHNYEAYIVGGAVRDLLTGREPKDFDITTDAHPERVRRVFRNSRVIGKRFRLAHVYFQNGKIHEVATYRSIESGHGRHVYGTLVDDAFRRDFTLNALYFDTEEETVIDFVGGVNDIRKRIVRSVLPLDSSFVEDPVRMLRAVKYAAIADMRISKPLGRSIKQHAALLSTASVSRLAEELNKIQRCLKTENIFRLMDRYSLIASILPNFDRIFRGAGDGNAVKNAFFANLAKLDQTLTGEESERGMMIRHLTEDCLKATGIFDGSEPPGFEAAVQEIKSLLLPMVQPNRYVEEAARLMFIERNLKFPHKREKGHRGWRQGRRLAAPSSK